HGSVPYVRPLCPRNLGPITRERAAIILLLDDLELWRSLDDLHIVLAQAFAAGDLNLGVCANRNLCIQACLLEHLDMQKQFTLCVAPVLGKQRAPGAEAPHLASPRLLRDTPLHRRHKRLRTRLPTRTCGAVRSFRPTRRGTYRAFRLGWKTCDRGPPSSRPAC